MNNITCPCCGGNKATQVNENEFRCEYCGNTFTVSRPEPVQQQVNQQQVYQQPANQQPVYQQPVGQQQYVADYAVGDMQELEEEHSNPIVRFLLKYKWFIIGLTLLIIIGNFAEKSNKESMENYILGSWTTTSGERDVEGAKMTNLASIKFDKDKTFVEEGKNICKAIIDGEEVSWNLHYKSTGTWDISEATFHEVGTNKTKKGGYNLVFTYKTYDIIDVTSETMEFTEEDKAEAIEEAKKKIRNTAPIQLLIKKNDDNSMTLMGQTQDGKISTISCQRSSSSDS